MCYRKVYKGNCAIEEYINEKCALEKYTKGKCAIERYIKESVLQ